MKKNDRFIKVHSENHGLTSLIEIWVDKETGVNYLYQALGSTGGVTPLLDQNGKPIITYITNE